MILINGMFKCGCYNTGVTRNQCRQMFYWKPLKRLVTTLASHYCVYSYRSRSISRFCITYPTPFTKTSHRELSWLQASTISSQRRIHYHVYEPSSCRPPNSLSPRIMGSGINCLFVGKNQLPLVVSTNRVRRSTIGRFR